MTMVDVDNRPAATIGEDAAHRVFQERWSPRSFLSDPVAEHDVRTMLDAARRAPSQKNSQPWRFFVATDGAPRDWLSRFVGAKNRVWCDAAPVLVAVVTEHPGSTPDREMALFDAGSAWMSMALQAEFLGLRAHAMGGIDRDGLLAGLELDPATHFAVCMVAIGRQGERDALPDHLRERERQGGRREIDEIATWL